MTRKTFSISSQDITTEFQFLKFIFLLLLKKSLFWFKNKHLLFFDRFVAFVGVCSVPVCYSPFCTKLVCSPRWPFPYFLGVGLVLLLHSFRSRATSWVTPTPVKSSLICWCHVFLGRPRRLVPGTKLVSFYCTILGNIIAVMLQISMLTR